VWTLKGDAQIACQIRFCQGLLAAAKGDRTTAQLASQFGIHTSQVTAWKKLLLGQVAELFADGHQRRSEQAADEQELYEQIGRLKMEVEWLKKKATEVS
jgi:transposase-like protein